MLEIEVLTSPDCRPCEHLKKLLNEVLQQLSGEIGQVELQEIDVIENPDVVVKYGVLATPAMAVNGRLWFTGVPKRGELIDRIVKEARGS